jgi:predicted ArsR family transcriptional regulator
MLSDLNRISLVARREIEARLAGSMLEALTPLIGPEAAREKLREAIANLARQAGAQMAARQGDNSLAAMDTVVEMWGYDGAMDVTVLARDNTRYHFNVTRCAYAEMYRELGLADLGLIISCGRDFPFFQGFNPAIQLTRTQTILGGAAFCDFRFGLAPSTSTRPQRHAHE